MFVVYSLLKHRKEFWLVSFCLWRREVKPLYVYYINRVGVFFYFIFENIFLPIYINRAFWLLNDDLKIFYFWPFALFILFIPLSFRFQLANRTSNNSSFRLLNWTVQVRFSDKYFSLTFFFHSFFFFSTLMRMDIFVIQHGYSGCNIEQNLNVKMF